MEPLKRDDFVACRECKQLNPAVYNDCAKPCSWVIAWVSHETSREVVHRLMKVRWEK